MLYPRSSSALITVPISRPSLDERSPGTFSRIKLCAFVSSRSRQISQNNPDRDPLSPALLPATDKSWHGNPPVMIPFAGSNPASISCSPVTPVISPYSFEFGNRRARTPCACLSHSTVATTLIPALSIARSKPPMPANSETPVFIIDSPLLFILACV